MTHFWVNHFYGINKTIERLLEPSSMDSYLRASEQVEAAKRENAPSCVVLELEDVRDECARTLRVRVMRAAVAELAVRP